MMSRENERQHFMNYFLNQENCLSLFECSDSLGLVNFGFRPSFFFTYFFLVDAFPDKLAWTSNGIAVGAQARS